MCSETSFVAPFKPMSRIAKALMKAPVYVYRYTFKPLTGGQCRHWPTCSQYALDAIELNGAWRGFWLTLSRFMRCGPRGTHGVDPAPDIRGQHHPFAPWRYGIWRRKAQAAAPEG